MLTSTRGHLGIDDSGFLVRFGHVRRGRGSYPVRLGPMADPGTALEIPEWLIRDYEELWDRWNDGPSHEEYRDEVRQTYYRGLS